MGPIGLWMLFALDAWMPRVGGAIFTFASILVVISLFDLFKKEPLLTIGPDGIHDFQIFGFVPWSEVTGVRLAPVETEPVTFHLVIDVRDFSLYRQRARGVAGFFLRTGMNSKTQLSLSLQNAAAPPPDILEMANYWRGVSAGQHPAPPTLTGSEQWPYRPEIAPGTPRPPVPRAMLLAFILPSLIGLGTIAFGVRALYFAQVSPTWPTALAVIQSSHVDVNSSGDSDSYSPKISYTYQVAGISYTSAAIAPGQFYNAGKAYRIVDRYPAGSQQLAHYNPAKPSQSYLNVGIRGGSYCLLLFGTIVLSFGSFFGMVAYYTPSYGTSVGNRVTFPLGSPPANCFCAGFVLIAAQFALFFWLV